MAKLIVRIKGGLGNQLFCYAAARRLALANDAELIIDHVTGFCRDLEYRRHYSLDSFNISARKATPSERLEPFERYRRGFKKYGNRLFPFTRRNYVEQEKLDFDPRLLDLKIRGTVYLDGLWQSEGYFADIESVIRKDLMLAPVIQETNRSMAEQISGECSVGVHFRLFENSGKNESIYNMPTDYYKRALSEIKKRVQSPVFFLFSDAPKKAVEIISSFPDRPIQVSGNSPLVDMWLMSKCKHFVIANSTFSWWGAWLSESKSKVVIVPRTKLTGITAWGFRGLIPHEWLEI